MDGYPFRVTPDGARHTVRQSRIVGPGPGEALPEKAPVELLFRENQLLRFAGAQVVGELNRQGFSVR